MSPSLTHFPGAEPQLQEEVLHSQAEFAWLMPKPINDRQAILPAALRRAESLVDPLPAAMCRGVVPS